MRTFLVFLALGLPVGALAEDVADADDAPAVTKEVATFRQLAWELHQLAKRDAWTGVERVYQQMDSLGLEIGPDEHLLGANSAQGIGNVAATLERLRRAHALREDRAVIEWMYRLDTGFGTLVIQDERKRRPTLESDKSFFMPDANKAVRFAAAEAEDGEFSGMLPEGTYRYGKESFEIVAGETVELSFEK